MKLHQVNTSLPEIGLVRISQFIPDIIHISKSSWWAGVKDGRYPQSVKLGPGITTWNVRDIRALAQYGLNWKQEVTRG